MTYLIDRAVIYLGETPRGFDRLSSESILDIHFEQNHTRHFQDAVALSVNRTRVGFLQNLFYVYTGALFASFVRKFGDNSQFPGCFKIPKRTYEIAVDLYIKHPEAFDQIVDTAETLDEFLALAAISIP